MQAPHMLLLSLIAGCVDNALLDLGDEDVPDSGDSAQNPPIETFRPNRSCGEPDTAPLGAPVDESCFIRQEVLIEGDIEFLDRSMGGAYSTPVVGPLDDDNGDGIVGPGDVPEILYVSENYSKGPAHTLYALGGDGSGTRWSYDDVSDLSPAIGDLDQDGWPEVVTSTEYGILALRGVDGSAYWYSDHYLQPGWGANQVAAIAIHDLDADGWPEVVTGQVIRDGRTGVIRGIGQEGIGTAQGFAFAAISSVADVNDDGLQEVVVGNAIYDANGNTLWANGEDDGYTAVANFDGDPMGEIVVGTVSGVVRLQDDDGTVLWETLADNSALATPAVADIKSDGRPVIVVGGSSRVSAIDAAGTLLWSFNLDQNPNTATPPVLFDFDGDGVVEVVVIDKYYLRILDGSNGVLRWEFDREVTSSDIFSPVIADVDLDGEAEIVLQNLSISTSPTNGLIVFGSKYGGWMPARPIWNQHGFTGADVDDNGHIRSGAPPAWNTQNSYRAAALTIIPPTLLPDPVPLLVDTCALSCDEGLLQVVVQVGNGGMGDQTVGVTVQIIGGDARALLAESTTGPLAAGASTESLVFDLDAEAVGERLEVLVVGDKAEVECHDDNNQVVVTEGLCP